MTKQEKRAPELGAEIPNETPHDVEKVALRDSHTLGSESEQDDQPTEEEKHTLRRVSDHIPVKAYTIGFVELVERMSYYGTTAV